MIIRAARAEDGLAVATVRVASWRATYRGIVPGKFLDGMSAEENASQWSDVAAGKSPGARLLVCEDGHAIVGFAAFGAARPPAFGHSGELYAMYFLPDAIGQGFGRSLTVEAARGLIALGHNDMIVWVMEVNARARRFYEARGGALIADSRKGFDIDGQTLWEVAYGYRPLSALGRSS